MSQTNPGSFLASGDEREARPRGTGQNDTSAGDTHRPCGLCGHVGATTVRSTDGGDYARCRRCRAEVQIGSELSAEEKFDEEQERYYDEQSVLMSPLLRTIHRNHARQRLSMLRRYLPSGRLLEVGPGMGDVLDLAKAAGYEIEGVEHSPVLARKIQEQHDVTVHSGAFEDLDLPNGLCDGWLSFHVVEHVPDPIAHLAKAAQVVRPDGYAFIATPSTGSWQHRILGHWSSSYSTAHLHLFSDRGLKAVLERVGWEVVEIRTVTPPESWPRFLTACIRRLRGRSAGAQRAGTAIRKTPTALGTDVLRVFQVASAPLRAIQDRLLGGHELFIIARRRGESCR